MNLDVKLDDPTDYNHDNIVNTSIVVGDDGQVRAKIDSFCFEEIRDPDETASFDAQEMQALADHFAMIAERLRDEGNKGYVRNAMPSELKGIKITGLDISSKGALVIHGEGISAYLEVEDATIGKPGIELYDGAVHSPAGLDPEDRIEFDEAREMLTGAEIRSAERGGEYSLLILKLSAGTITAHCTGGPSAWFQPVLTTRHELRVAA